jgi:hypothetical protein
VFTAVDKLRIEEQRRMRTDSPRSPDPTLADLYLWEHPKSGVCDHKSNIQDELRTVTEATEMANTSRLLFFSRPGILDATGFSYFIGFNGGLSTPLVNR